MGARSHPERTSRAVLPPARGRAALDRSCGPQVAGARARSGGTRFRGVGRARSAGRRGGGPVRGFRRVRRAGSAFPPFLRAHALALTSGPAGLGGWGVWGTVTRRAPSSATSPGPLLGALGPGTPGEICVPRGRGYSRSRAPWWVSAIVGGSGPHHKDGMRWQAPSATPCFASRRDAAWELPRSCRQLPPSHPVAAAELLRVCRARVAGMISEVFAEQGRPPFSRHPGQACA